VVQVHPGPPLPSRKSLQLVDLRENFLLILYDGAEGGLILQNGRLIPFDGFLIRFNGFLVCENRFLVL
jgi:hypothetical protein